MQAPSVARTLRSGCFLLSVYDQRLGERAAAKPVSDVTAPKPNGQPELRRQLFRETPLERLERVALGLAWSLMPQRIGALPALIRIWLRDRFSGSRALPDPNSPLNGDLVVGVAYDLTRERIVAAAKRGLYPLGHIGQPKWCSPETRALLFFRNFHISKSARKAMRKGQYSVTFDQAFERVIVACAGRRAGHWHVNWITPKMMHAYADLFDAGIAHSIEVWNEKGELVGGGYGVAIGKVFIGESLFSAERDTSKIAVAVLSWHLARWGFRFIDTKLINPLMESFGFREIPRAEFLAMNETPMNEAGRIGRWQTEADTETIADWRPEAGPAPAERA